MYGRYLVFFFLPPRAPFIIEVSEKSYSMTLSSSGLTRGSPYSGKFNFKIPDRVGNDQYFSEHSILN